MNYSVSFVNVISFQICLILKAHFYKRNFHSTQPFTHAHTHVHQSFKTYWVFKCYKGRNQPSQRARGREERKKEKSLTFSTLYSHHISSQEVIIFSFLGSLRLIRVRFQCVKVFNALFLTLKCVHKIKRRWWLREL